MPYEGVLLYPGSNYLNIFTGGSAVINGDIEP